MLNFNYEYADVDNLREALFGAFLLFCNTQRKKLNSQLKKLTSMDKLGFCQIGGMTILTENSLNERLSELYHDENSKEQQKFKTRFEDYLKPKLAEEQRKFIGMLFEIYETFKVKIAELYKLGVVDKLYSNES